MYGSALLFFNFFRPPPCLKNPLSRGSSTARGVGTAFLQHGSERRCWEDAGWVVGTQGPPVRDPGAVSGLCRWPRRSGLGKQQAMEVSINQVKHQLINCQPPVSRDLREKKNIYSH